MQVLNQQGLLLLANSITKAVVSASWWRSDQDKHVPSTSMYAGGDCQHCMGRTATASIKQVNNIRRFAIAVHGQSDRQKFSSTKSTHDDGIQCRSQTMHAVPYRGIRPQHFDLSLDINIPIYIFLTSCRPMGVLDSFDSGGSSSIHNIH